MIGLGELNQLVAELQSAELIGTVGVAGRLEVTPAEVREWARTGILPATRISGRLVFKLSEIRRWQLDGIERLGGPADIGGDPLARPGEIT